MVNKDKIEKIVKKVYDELMNFKQEKEEIHELRGDGKKEHKELKKMLNTGIRDKNKRSYNKMKENKKENIIFVKPKIQ